MVDLIEEEDLDYTMEKLSSQQALSSLSVNGQLRANVKPNTPRR